MPRGSLKEYAPKHLGEKLKAIREAFDYSQTEMAERLGFPTVKPASISQYESGQRLPPYLVLLKYARIGGVYVDVLLDDKMKIYPNKEPIPKGQLLRFAKKRSGI